MFHRWLSLVTCCAALVSVIQAAEIPYTIEQSIDETLIRIPALDQQILTRDLLAALSESAEWDGRVLSEKLPRGDIDLSKKRTRVTLDVVEKLLRQRAQFEIEKDPQAAARALVVHIDRAQLEMDRRDELATWRKKIAAGGPLVGQSTDDLRWGLQGLDAATVKPGQRVVILIHGLQGSHDSLQGFLSPVRKAGFACGTFAYPNDGPIEDSARLLADSLKALQLPAGARISLVTHSMGGLVSRRVIEDPTLFDPRIDQLIMICPPNHGSMLAYLPPGMDLHEHLHDRPVSELPEFIFRSSVDGFNEACHDLRPQSRFLLQLNAQPRNAQVRYGILLGNVSPASAAQLNLVAEKINQWSQKSDTFRFLSFRLRKALDHPLELTPGEGDGAVAVTRGKLVGVSDTVVLAMDHWTADDHIRSEAGQMLIGEVLKRLTSEP